jgi:hypothetical protein
MRHRIGIVLAVSTTQLTPIRVTTLAPIPTAPWHDPSDPRPDP